MVFTKESELSVRNAKSGAEGGTPGKKVEAAEKDHGLYKNVLKRSARRSKFEADNHVFKKRNAARSSTKPNAKREKNGATSLEGLPEGEKGTEKGGPG